MMRRAEPRSEGTPSMGDLGAILARRKLLILAVALPFIALSALYSYTRTAVYATTTGILVTPVLTSLTAISRPPEIDGQTESNLATSVAVATEAKTLMGSTLTPQQLLQQVTANMVNGTQFLTISFSDPDPVTAQRGATAFADAYLGYRQTQALGVIEHQGDAIGVQLADARLAVRSVSERLEELPPGAPQRVGLETRREALSDRHLALQTQLISLLSITTNAGDVIDPASVPSTPASPRHEFDLAIGIVLGLGLGFAAAILKERSSDAVRSPAGLEESLGAPVLASIPKMRRRGQERVLAVAGGKRDISADAYRRLRTGVLGIAASSDTKTILITSAVGGEGKTATVANLGAALAEIGKRVVLVSADLRRPALQRIFPTSDPLGLNRALSDGMSHSELVHETSIPNLRFVPSGTPLNQIEPVNLLQSDRMRGLLAEWERDADFVLLDSPPVLGVPDSLVLARIVDGVLFVADARTSRWEDVISASDELERAGGVLLAGVLNGVSISRRGRRAWTDRGFAARPTAIERSRPVRRPQALSQEL